MSLPSTSSSLVISAFPSSLACMIFLKVIRERPIFLMSFLPAAGLSNDLTPYLRLVEEARNSLVEFRVRDVTSASPLISTGDPSIDTFSSPNANLGCLSPDAFRQAFGHLSFQDRQG